MRIGTRSSGLSFDGGAFPQVAWAVGLPADIFADEDLLSQA
jgi:hypothetical protein